MLLDIRTVGDPVLRQAARPLDRKEILSVEIRQLIENMRETMRKTPGVGLAAPQVGIGVQLAMIEDRREYMKDFSAESLAERERKPVPFHVIINPVLSLMPDAEAEFFEGCLSLPGFLAIVKRARAVRVECLDHRGRPATLRAAGWHARILQHEIDHLHGRLYIDSMHSRSFCTLDNYTKHWKDLSLSEAGIKLGI